MPPETYPILVTGAHRTGTTWVGRVLAAAPRIAYISEPLNVLHRPGVFRAPTRHWYTYVCQENEGQYLDAFHQLLSFRYHLLAEIACLRSLHDVGRMVRDLIVLLDGGIHHKLPLLKDPFAVFSLRWFYDALHARICVTVRHPAAFASGLKRLNWTFDFANLLQQPLLMRDHLGRYREAMLSPATSDVIGQAGLLWAMIYGTLQELRSQLPDLQVVRHEDLALGPMDGFRDLYRGFGLEFTARVERLIKSSSSPANPAELAQGRVHSVRMDSRASLQNWKHRLTPEEVVRIRKLTDGVAQLYYPEESWN